MTEASIRDLKATRVDPLDLTRADLWAEDRWHEPFRELRAKGPIHRNERRNSARTGPSCSTSRSSISRHCPRFFRRAGNLAASLSSATTSSIMSDFNVPLPMFIAMDPPKHTAQRRTVAPAFGPAKSSGCGPMRSRGPALLDSLPDWRAVRLGRIRVDGTDHADARHPVRFSLGRAPQADPLVRCRRRHRNRLHVRRAHAIRQETGANWPGRSWSCGNARRKTPAAAT